MNVSQLTIFRANDRGVCYSGCGQLQYRDGRAASRGAESQIGTFLAGREGRWKAMNKFGDENKGEKERGVCLDSC